MSDNFPIEPTAANHKSRSNNLRLVFAVLGTTLCLLTVGVLVYRDFLFGNATLLYKDSGSDSVNDYYPWFVHLSQYIRSEGLPSWSFYVGMGQDIFFFAGYLVLQPVCWLSKELIGPALVYQHILKVVITGLLFFRFLHLRRLNPLACVTGSLLVALSAYMCMGACWYPLADEVLGFSALLLAVEEALTKGRWIFLPLAVALIGFIDSFHLYLCALCLAHYVPARLFARYGWQPRLLARTCLLLAAAAALGVGLGAILTIPNLHTLLHSPRGSGSTSFFSFLRGFPVFGLAPKSHNVSAVLRLFSNDMMGTAENFRGWQNYLEAPLSYCGLLCLLLLPQAFVGASRREKIVYGVLCGAILLTTAFPWFRFLFWAFQGDYYRTLSLFSILGLITLSMIAFSRYIRGRLSLPLLGATGIVVVGVLYLPWTELQSVLDPQLKNYAVIFLAAYIVLLGAGRLARWPQVAALAIVALVGVELVLFDRITVSRRSTVSKQELKERVGYNDNTLDAIRDIKAEDSGGFYRITKIRPSGPGSYPSMNDAMVFGYYGTSSYSSFNNINYINFLTAVEAIPPRSEQDTRWSVGLMNDALLSLFAGERYVLAEDPLPFQRALQYEFVKQYEKDFLFRNARFLPLGLGFDRYVTQNEFASMTPAAKPWALLHAVIVPEKGDAERLGLRPANLLEIDEAARALSLPDIVATRRKNALELTWFSQTKIEGLVRLDQKSVLIVQTPFDTGWSALQDDKPAAVLKVDAGLLGVALDAGEHKVALRYKTPYLAFAGLVSLISAFILGLAAWRWGRLNLPDPLL
ncbi:MAG TPA: YfhO family protein [Chthoniobacterales bacterium]|nr:YfhO family protein [Chthoniobacterales bacterium]